MARDTPKNTRIFPTCGLQLRLLRILVNNLSILMLAPTTVLSPKGGYARNLRKFDRKSRNPLPHNIGHDNHDNKGTPLRQEVYRAGDEVINVHQSKDQEPPPVTRSNMRHLSLGQLGCHCPVKSAFNFFPPSLGVTWMMPPSLV